MAEHSTDLRLLRALTDECKDLIIGPKPRVGTSIKGAIAVWQMRHCSIELTFSNPYTLLVVPTRFGSWAGQYKFDLNDGELTPKVRDCLVEIKEADERWEAKNR